MELFRVFSFPFFCELSFSLSFEQKQKAIAMISSLPLSWNCFHGLVFKYLCLYSLSSLKQIINSSFSVDLYEFSLIPLLFYLSLSLSPPNVFFSFRLISLSHWFVFRPKIQILAHVAIIFCCCCCCYRCTWSNWNKQNEVLLMWITIYHIYPFESVLILRHFLFSKYFRILDDKPIFLLVMVSIIFFFYIFWI